MDKKSDRLDMVIKRVFTRMKGQIPKPVRCPDDELLAAYRAGTLTQVEMEKIEEHLGLCENCTESLLSLAEAEGSYSPAQDTFVSKKSIKKVKALIKPRDTGDIWEKVFSWFAVMRPIPVMATASVVFILVVFGIYNLHGPTVEMNIIARIPSDMQFRGTEQDYKKLEIQNGGELHSGDMFKIKFELQEEAYIYILSLDSRGNISKIFPAKDAESPVKFKSHKPYTFPDNNNVWLKLDTHTGKETIYLLVSSTPIGNINQKIDQLGKTGIDKITKIMPGVKVQSFRFMHK